MVRATLDQRDMTAIEVFADVSCPFTHVGLRRLVDVRGQVAPDLFEGLAPSAFPGTSLPALALASAAY